jgi:hypothetical protein
MRSPAGKDRGYKYVRNVRGHGYRLVRTGREDGD